MRTPSLTVILRRAAIVILPCAFGCFAEPEPAQNTSSSTGGSGPGASTNADGSSSGPGGSSISETTDGSTGLDGSTTGTGSTGSIGGSTGSTGDRTTVAESSASDTSPPPGLCPMWQDEFEDPQPVWQQVAGDLIEQSGGRVNITLPQQTDDFYPRQRIPWMVLGMPESVRFQMTPATLPTQMGTQLNTIFEGPPGSDVTLALNYTSELQYRLTVREDDSETFLMEESAVFPEDGSVQFEISDGMATVSILDETGASVLEFDSVEIPFALIEGKLGFAANNWTPIPAEDTLSVESFQIRCD
ncbi:MAG: hypothetical protein AAGA54_14155 [Myxococcota bacterium]